MEKTNIPAASVTPQMIAEWKKKHGGIFKIIVDDKSCYLKKPDRKLLSFASTLSKDMVKFNEAILKGCWLAGDEEIQTDDTLFLSACGKLDGIIEQKEAELVKL